MKGMKNLHIALFGLAGALMMGCAGVNPSVELGFLYTPPVATSSVSTSVSADGITASAGAWALGGSFKGTFKEKATVLESCGNVQYTNTTTKTNLRGVVTEASSWTIPGEVCAEFEPPTPPG